MEGQDEDNDNDSIKKLTEKEAVDFCLVGLIKNCWNIFETCGWFLFDSTPTLPTKHMLYGQSFKYNSLERCVTLN